MAKSEVVTLELRTSRNTVQGAAAMAQFLAALPHPPKQFWRFWQKAPWLSLEFFNQGQSIYVLLTLPAALREYVSSQLSANYPEVLIKVLAHNPLQDFGHDKPKAQSEVFLSAPTQYPLQSFENFKEGDPLAALLSALSKLQAEETAVVQLLFRKTRERWKTQVNNGARTGAEGQPATPPLHHDLVAQKLTLPSFQFCLRLVTQAPTQERANQLLESLQTALAAFQSEANSLVAKTPIFRKQALITAVIARQPVVRNQYLSQSELATLFHLPYLQLSTIKNIAWGKTLAGEPPENLPVADSFTEEQRRELNFFAKTEYKNMTTTFGIKKVDRRKHLYVIGKTGAGKSTMIANMAINDMRNGEGLAVIDPHGDLTDILLQYIPSYRINDVAYLDPSDTEYPFHLNPLEVKTDAHRELFVLREDLP
jgi:hypothetical protein